ncbi:zinc-binding alcohol dehydrogenase family protein [Rhizobium wenxiniae]|uniref:Zinc-type alcohol dehydrogenase-like protein n=1 Tax=Rhizobium wenxiniae TaxID=1737357 RepID=A0A7X0D1M3_9HYPH|nr:zinc-binding alcohol dehydrogenase family protein [Rhizobium wenxiniae]MBB6163661.1 zinc-binding alcohol dehydrogenase family protein [Rhizobium wenxiniae]GGG12071.1 oxidoreductase [Rhizobium wenxiniae]
MKAIGYYKNKPVTEPDALVDIEVPKPEPGPHDLLVKVEAISVNPADVKQRGNSAPTDGQARILGYDAVGIVEKVGSSVRLFEPGDAVFYAGAINRQGTYAEYHVVDERVVGPKPKTISSAEAAALPLTSLTAWELLFEKLGVQYGTKSSREAILIINGAGGVGSVLTQIARRLTGLTVIATASRPETIDWVKQMGAHHVVDHRKPLDEEMRRIGIPHVKYVAGLTATDRHQQAILEILKPRGALAMIDDPDIFDVVKFKRKSLSVHWELMFTPTLFQTPEMDDQHRILTEISALVDSGVIKTTMRENAGKITAENLRNVHALLESGRGLGKTVLSGF